MVSILNVCVGDTVEVRCEDKSCYTPGSDKVFVGVVSQVFDALTDDLQEGINLEIDVKNSKGEWFRYKPLIDGGTITVLKQWRER